MDTERLDYEKTERRVAGNIIAERYNIIGTKVLVYCAWEPIDFKAYSHTTITTIDGKWHGMVGTLRPPAEIEALPACTPERSNAYWKFHEADDARALEAILAVFPEAEGGRWSLNQMYCMAS